VIRGHSGGQTAALLSKKKEIIKEKEKEGGGVVSIGVKSLNQNFRDQLKKKESSALASVLLWKKLAASGGKVLTRKQRGLQKGGGEKGQEVQRAKTSCSSKTKGETPTTPQEGRSMTRNQREETYKAIFGCSALDKKGG